MATEPELAAVYTSGGIVPIPAGPFVHRYAAGDADVQATVAPGLALPFVPTRAGCVVGLAGSLDAAPLGADVTATVFVAGVSASTLTLTFAQGSNATAFVELDAEQEIPCLAGAALDVRCSAPATLQNTPTAALWLFQRPG